MAITPAQRAARQRGVGSSDAPAVVLGADEFKTRLDIFCEKTLPLPPESDAVDERSDGNDLEPAVRAMAARRLGVSVVEDAATHVHPTRDYMLAHLDGRTGDGGGFEAKICSWQRARELGEPGTDAVLRPWLIQCCHAMEVTGLPFMHLAALVGVHDLRLFVIERDAELGGMIADIEGRFWREHVLAKVPPPATDPTAALRYMRARYPEASAIELQAEPGTGAYEALAELRASRVAVKAAKELEKLCAARVQDLMGTARKITCDLGAVTWANQKGRTAWAKVAREAAVPKEVIAKHTGTGARKFLPKFNDDADDGAED